ncbi:DUF6886 family protein [Brevibacillus centrosporus]|uniref:DUF6886 family protein n=1 Tax=Brevibacillus centrosporus TaxID=54910 RepID=UPI002E24B9AC|nr:DUF6886 family protein [Brevibacillus centrosporus]MED1949300.1 hypothetical protein [Brevibacillus centrosporus]
MSLLYHFSEDPNIQAFVPQLHPSHPSLPPAVWAIDEAHAPMYYLPRDCPRIAFRLKQDTSAEDKAYFLDQTQAEMVIAVESGWCTAIRNTVLYRYSFAAQSFSCWDKGAGYYRTHSGVSAVYPLKIEPMGDLFSRLCEANVELRLTPSLTPLREFLLPRTLQFSMIRMRNARP